MHPLWRSSNHYYDFVPVLWFCTGHVEENKLWDNKQRTKKLWHSIFKSQNKLTTIVLLLPVEDATVAPKETACPDPRRGIWSCVLKAVSTGSGETLNASSASISNASGLAVGSTSILLQAVRCGCRSRWSFWAIFMFEPIVCLLFSVCKFFFKSFFFFCTSRAAWAHIVFTARMPAALCCDTLRWCLYLSSANDALVAATAAAHENTVSNDAQSASLSIEFVALEIWRRQTDSYRWRCS